MTVLAMKSRTSWRWVWNRLDVQMDEIHHVVTPLISALRSLAAFLIEVVKLRVKHLHGGVEIGGQDVER